MTNLINTDFTVTLRDTVSSIDRKINFYTICFTWKQKKIWKTSPKRYSEFEEFDSVIKHISNDPLIGELPPKLVLHTKEGLEMRKKKLINYIYSITKSVDLIQIPEVRKFFDIPTIVQLYYKTVPMQLPSVSTSELPESIREMYSDGCTWTTHFQRMFTSLHQLPTFDEQENFLENENEMISNMRQFFKIQMDTFGKCIKESNSNQIIKDIFSTSHLIWVWLVNMPQIVHSMNSLPPPSFMDVMKYMNKETGELNIPTSITTTTGNTIQDFYNQIDSIRNRASLVEQDVVKNGFVISSFTKNKILELHDEIKKLVDSVVSYNQFLNAENCIDIKELYVQATDLDIAFGKRLAILVDRKPEFECSQKGTFIETSKSKDNKAFTMKEMYQPFTL